MNVGAAILVALVWWSVSELALVALNMIGMLALELTIDAFGPISGNVCNAAEISQMNGRSQERPSDLDAAGNAAAATDRSRKGPRLFCVTLC